MLVLPFEVESLAAVVGAPRVGFKDAEVCSGGGPIGEGPAGETSIGSSPRNSSCEGFASDGEEMMGIGFSKLG